MTLPHPAPLRKVNQRASDTKSGLKRRQFGSVVGLSSHIILMFVHHAIGCVKEGWYIC